MGTLAKIAHQLLKSGFSQNTGYDSSWEYNLDVISINKALQWITMNTDCWLRSNFFVEN